MFLNRKEEETIIAKLPYDFELAHRFRHKKCGERAYLTTVINETEAVWECLVHGFITRGQVVRI